MCSLQKSVKGVYRGQCKVAVGLLSWQNTVQSSVQTYVQSLLHKFAAGVYSSLVVGDTSPLITVVHAMLSLCKLATRLVLHITSGHMARLAQSDKLLKQRKETVQKLTAGLCTTLLKICA